MKKLAVLFLFSFSMLQAQTPSINRYGLRIGLHGAWIDSALVSGDSLRFRVNDTTTHTKTWYSAYKNPPKGGGTDTTLSIDTLRTYDFRLRNSAGIDTARIKVDYYGNMTFYYRKPSYTDTAFVRGELADSTQAFLEFDEGCNTTPTNTATFTANFTVPHNTAQGFSIRYYQFPVRLSYKKYGYINSMVYARAYIGGSDPSTQTLVGTFTFSNNSTTTDTTVSGFISLNTSGLTFDDLGLVADSTYRFRMYTAYHNTRPTVPPATGCEPNPDYFQSTGYDSVLAWTPGSLNTYPAAWMESGHFKHDTLYTSSIVVSGKVTANEISAGSATLNTLTVGADSVAGTIKAKAGNGKTGTINFPVSADRSWSLVDASGIIPTTNNIPVPVAAFPLVFTLTHNGGVDTLHGSVAGTADSTLRSYISCPADMPPASPGSLNDEFNGAVFDSTRWERRNWSSSPQTTITQQSGIMTIGVPLSAAWKGWQMLVQTIPTADTAAWTWTGKVTNSNIRSGIVELGICAFNTTSKKLVHIGPISRASASQNGWEITKWTDSVTYSTTPYIDGNCTGNSMYFRLQKTATDSIFAFMSFNGITWGQAVYGEKTSAFIESSGTINRLGVLINSNNANYTAYADFWWVRYNWTATYNPTVNY